jgi:alpha-mannosidase
VLAVAESEGRTQALVEVPATGFGWVGPGTGGDVAGTPRAKQKSANDPLVVEQHELRNEYFQARIGPTTGAIQSLQSYAIRGNRLAQQIAMRVPPSDESQQDIDPEAEENYSLMAADEITASRLGPMEGRIVSRGRLVHRSGEQIARFVQTMTARRGSPVLELEIELDIQRLPEPSPWRSYYAVRFAWSDETADVFQGVGLCRQPSDGKYLESPHFIEIAAPKTRLTVFPAGLPYHRRFGLRKLDTLLVVHGETARKFRLGIGVDARYPAHAAMDLLVPPGELCRPASAPATPWGWLFHLDARNVMATHWEPLCSQGHPTGFRVRLLETEGRHSEFVLRSFRPVASAQRVDFLGGLQSELPVDGDQIHLELQPRQWIQMEATFADEKPAL